MRIEDVSVILLAAGRGTRFGGGKLAALLDGRPLVHHAAAMLGGLPFARRIAVVAPGVPDLAAFGFAAVSPAADAPLSASLAAGLAGVEDPVLIALGDMPRVTAGHIRALVAAFAGDRIASLDGAQPLPPALFGAQHLPALRALTGDRGAGALLKGAPGLALPPGAAIDIDTPADLSFLAGAGSRRTV